METIVTVLIVGWFFAAGACVDVVIERYKAGYRKVLWVPVVQAVFCASVGLFILWSWA